MIAHESEGCDLADARNWRTRSSIHVIMDGFRIQVDATPEFRLQCIRNDLRDIDIFILTHEHADHIMGMDDLRRFCDRRNHTAIPVYSQPRALQRIKEIYPYAIGAKPVHKGYAAFELRELPPLLEIPGGTIRSVLLEHGAITTLGLVFEERSSGAKFVYYNDCRRVEPEARDLAKGADTVVLDGLRPQAHPTHMSIEEAVETALAIGAPINYLTHMTFHVDHASWERRLPETIQLAYDGLRLQL